jgi:2-oxoglutarate ferredoxin oxidoreductase subunit alpha
MARVLMKGCEAMAEAAIRAGGLAYFCYPITPQTEVAEYLAKRMPDVGGVFLQAESELAASNMLYGAAGAGVRVFTTSSSPGISLMSEAFSYITAAELPCVVINVIRCGPGLGGILPSQGDYFQATKGPGHGDFRFLVLAPATLQETVDLVKQAFDLADKYCNPVLIIADGLLGQMMEAVELGDDFVKPADLPRKTWATDGCRGRAPNIVNTLYLDPYALERRNQKLRDKYDTMARDEIRFEVEGCEGELDVLLCAFGTVARIAKTAIEELREEGVRVGLFRPITLFPFPRRALCQAAAKSERVLVVEMNTGQMLEDVEHALAGRKGCAFFGRQGGVVPTPDEIKERLREVVAAPPPVAAPWAL